MKPYLVFVYNADTGVFNTLTDIAHKIFSPETYSCNLCAITYGNFSIRAEWKEFLESLDAEFEFLHRDELEPRYGVSGVPLPAVFVKKGEAVDIWINSEEINRCGSIEDLKALITARLAG
ncbi:hypothetical protein OR1_02161 [Geobacter sp. OR-1]|uniref:hypothetical protein n=1 Tax=Geobacter sp. OR-1 TaxID=1266765 RepID=UPI000541C0E2|nr:hypothetical protein [Geobacter sp. OR-1]GAM09879.1 hypothetical protein OR1_02161 [Geobacter sp. OR-1]